MALKNRSLSDQAAPVVAPNLLQMDESQLLQLRAAIDARLGISNLSQMNIEQEILVQLATAKDLQTTTLNDRDVPANQKAQTINAVAAILKELVKMQNDLYNAERIKELESAMIQALKDAPDEVKDRFFERYERMIAAAQTM